MGSSGSENIKTLLLLRIAAKNLKPVLDFPPNGLHKTALGVFEFLNFRILIILFQNFKFTIIAYGEMKNLNYLENEPS